MDTECCVCFRTAPDNIVSLNDMELQTTLDVEFEDVVVQSCCGRHVICVRCLRKIALDLENSPINENSSHIPCPYPFEECKTSIGFRCVFSHNAIKNICKNESEWQSYITYAEQYEFPGYTIVKCPLKLLDDTPCNTPALVSNDDIRNIQKGKLVIECNGSPQCWRKYCYWCHSNLSFYRHECFKCIYAHENDNPQAFNYYINKHAVLSDTLGENAEVDSGVEFTFNEADYLYRNRELTTDIVITQVEELMNDIHSFMICPVCKASLFKTEKCNGMSHHGIERCYSCGRIGYKVKGLCDHWNPEGFGGCFRFDNDEFVYKFVPEFKCYNEECTSHLLGDCHIEEHQVGISKLLFIRQRACVYHILKSLPSQLFESVYDNLYEKYSGNHLFLPLLPYKQTFVMLKEFGSRRQDYIEEILYSQLHVAFPTFVHKNNVIPVSDYMTLYGLKTYSQFDGLSTQDTMLIRSSTSQLLQRLLQNYHNPPTQELLPEYTSHLPESNGTSLTPDTIFFTEYAVDYPYQQLAEQDITTTSDPEDVDSSDNS